MATVTEKAQNVEELVSCIKDSAAIYLLSYQGIKVEKDNAWRKNLNKKGITYKVVKNTLLNRALDIVGIKGLGKYLTGTTAVLVGNQDDPMAPAREVVEFHKANPDFLTAKGIGLDGDVMNGDKLEDLAKMPTRVELLGTIIGLAMGPGACLVSILKGPASKIAGQVKALQEKLEK